MKNFRNCLGNIAEACRRQAPHRKCAVPLVIIAVLTIIGLSMTACGEDDGGYNTVSVGQLPEFPSGSNPAESKADAEAILAELRKTRIIGSIYEETWDVIDENLDEGNYYFNNRSLPGGSVKVSGNYSGNETSTGGFKKMYEDDEESDNIQFNKGDRGSSTLNYNFKAELIKAKIEGGITIANGSIFEYKGNYSDYITVSTAGTYSTFRTNISSSYKEQEIYAFTVTALSGSVKVILDMNYEGSETRNNVLYISDEEDDVGTETETLNISGSLKVYGSNNVLLIDHSIVDTASYETAWYLINYDPYTLNPADATPLANNVKVNGSTSQDSVALYSINVTSGTKYHLWWGRTDSESIYVSVRGYSDGNVFFDTQGDWTLEWEKYFSFTATSTGTVYIMVRPYHYFTNYVFNFAIVYNTSGNRPAMSVSAAPFRTNSGSIQNKMNTSVLRYNKR